MMLTNSVKCCTVSTKFKTRTTKGNNPMVAYMVNPEFIVDLYETPNSAGKTHYHNS